MPSERRSPTALQWVKDVVLTLLALVVAPLLAWLLVQAVEVQKDVVAMRLQIIQVQKDIVEHRAESDKDSNEVGKLHHRDNITPCTGCHK